MQERAKHDADFRKKLIDGSFMQAIKYQPLNDDEVSERMFQMMKERAKRDADFRKQLIEGCRTSNKSTQTIISGREIDDAFSAKRYSVKKLKR